MLFSVCMIPIYINAIHVIVSCLFSLNTMLSDAACMCVQPLLLTVEKSATGWGEDNFHKHLLPFPLVPEA